MSQTSCLVRPSPEVSTNWSCSRSPTTKCIVLRWQLMQSRNPAAARISRRLAPPATTTLPHHLLCDSFRKVSARKRPTLCRMASLQAAGSGAPHAGPVRASPVSRLLPHRLRWSKLQPPREWRNGRRAGLRIRCPKGRGSSTLPSRTPSDLRIFLPRPSQRGDQEGRLAHACSQKDTSAILHVTC